MKRKILFLCTRNSARSQMAEAILNSKNDDRYIAFSAGSNPGSEVNPLAVKVLQKMDIEIADKKPKSIQEFIDQEFDFIITLCDKAKEECPTFIGKPILAHWGTTDPADFEGSEQERLDSFTKVANNILNRISLFLSLPVENLEKMAMELKTKEIANIE